MIKEEMCLEKLYLYKSVSLSGNSGGYRKYIIYFHGKYITSTVNTSIQHPEWFSLDELMDVLYTAQVFI